LIVLSVRNGRIFALMGWACFLLWLQVADQVPRYLGPRTAWIVPLGAVAFALAALAQVRFTAESPSARRPLGLREAAGIAAVLAPPLVALCMADATLGSLAASNKLGDRGIDVARLADSLRDGSGPIDFLVLRVADEDPAMARRRGIKPGRAVELTGFVYKRSEAPGRPMRLARFYMTCCVADSVAIDVPVFGARAFPVDTWLTVTGVLAKRDGHFVVYWAKATKIEPPKHPYLAFKL
jgi:uncharacterized repeat protein (TIGR03943 family)